jgi:hypothetical protein
MAAVRFIPTWQQSLGRGLYHGVLVSVVAHALTLLAWFGSVSPPAWWWALLTVALPVTGAAGGMLLGPRRGIEIDAGGIRTGRPSVTDVEWDRVVDLRAERRGGRTVVSIYLDSGASRQLCAPYSGEFFAADPQFERKVSALSHLWRSHRFGGLPG